MNRTLEHILPRVQKPARYTGGEYNAVVKDRRAVDVRYALCFPDTYEIGMSNLGVRILYGLMNEMDGVWCERVFAPWGDMEEEMRREGIPLYGLDRCHFKSLFRSQSKLYRAFYIVINMSLSPYLFNVFIICTKAES